MALVAYDTNSESENEISEEDENSKVILHKPKELPTIFSALPEAKVEASSSREETEDKLEDFIPTVKSIKESKKVQITIPSLSDFDDIVDSEPLKKEIKTFS